MKIKLSIIAVSLALGAGLMSANAADNVTSAAHAGHDMSQNHDMSGGHDMSQPTILPTEGGQSAFTTIAEIVELLNQNPQTDWSLVDIDRLREHLVDMNELTINAKAQKTKEANVVTFTINGTGRTLQAIKSMVPAHSVELNKMRQWQVSVELQDEQVIMQVKSDDILVLAKVYALGFFGMMATGAHHQAHHWGMATGTLMNH